MIIVDTDLANPIHGLAIHFLSKLDKLNSVNLSLSQENDRAKKLADCFSGGLGSSFCKVKNSDFFNWPDFNIKYSKAKNNEIKSIILGLSSAEGIRNILNEDIDKIYFIGVEKKTLPFKVSRNIKKAPNDFIWLCKYVSKITFFESSYNWKIKWRDLPYANLSVNYIRNIIKDNYGGGIDAVELIVAACIVWPELIVKVEKRGLKIHLVNGGYIFLDGIGDYSVVTEVNMEELKKRVMEVLNER